MRGQDDCLELQTAANRLPPAEIARLILSFPTKMSVASVPRHQLWGGGMCLTKRLPKPSASSVCTTHGEITPGKP